MAHHCSCQDAEKKISKTSVGVLEWPRYSPGLILEDSDLTAAVDYTRALNRLLFRSLFGCGVVCGLTVSVGTDCGLQVTVAPGLALDGCGDPLHLAGPVTLELGRREGVLPPAGGRGPARADEGVLGRRLRRRKAVRPTHARLRRRRPRRHAPTDQNARHDGDLDLVHGAAMRMRVQAPRQRDGQRQARAFGEVAAASPMASDRPWSSWTRTVATGHIARTRAVRRTAAAAALARAVAASCSPGSSGPRPNGTRRAAGPWFTTASAGSSGRCSCPIRWRRSTISRG